MLLDELLKAINTAEYENLKQVTVRIEHLQELRHAVITLREQLKVCKKDLAVVDAKLSLCQLEKPIKLDMYI
jgi:hypothetical protein